MIWICMTFDKYRLSTDLCKLVDKYFMYAIAIIITRYRFCFFSIDIPGIDEVINIGEVFHIMVVFTTLTDWQSIEDGTWLITEEKVLIIIEDWAEGVGTKW